MKECEWDAVLVVSHPVRPRMAVAATVAMRRRKVDLIMGFGDV